MVVCGGCSLGVSHGVTISPDNVPAVAPADCHSTFALTL